MNKAKKWEQHIEQWKRSKKSKASYCRENGINAHTFDYWQGKLKKQSSFIELNSSSKEQLITIELREDIQIKLPVGISKENLVVVLEAVRAQS